MDGWSEEDPFRSRLVSSSYRSVRLWVERGSQFDRRRPRRAVTECLASSHDLLSQFTVRLTNGFDSGGESLYVGKILIFLNSR